MNKVLILHGINLNMFGKRNSDQYGTITLGEIDEEIVKTAADLGVSVECFQTNSEEEMVEKIHHAHEEKVNAVVINAGAWTHYSYGLMDALEILEVPVIEVHMTNIYSREGFRHDSVISHLAKGTITGFGLNSYLLGLRAAYDLLND